MPVPFVRALVPAFVRVRVRVRAGICALVAMAACGGAGGARPPSGGVATPPPLAASVRLVGRYDVTDPHVARLGWSASGAVVRFHGPRIDARLHDAGGHNVFQIVVDGAPTAVLTTSPTQDLYALAAGLADADHEVLLEKRTEGRVGEVELRGFVAEGGALLPPPPPRTRRIELIGDSITAGYGNEGANGHCRFSPGSENEFMTYGAIAARALEAEHATVAWSGRTIDGIIELYDRALPARPESRWDPRAFMPDVVIVNLGTNDVTRGDQQEAFVQSYVKLLERVRATHPQALIVCAVGPMLTDTYPPGKHTLTRAKKYVHTALDARVKAGDEKLRYLEFPTQNAANGYGCDFHPSMRTHELMAEQLVAFLKTELGW